MSTELGQKYSALVKGETDPDDGDDTDDPDDGGDVETEPEARSTPEAPQPMGELDVEKIEKQITRARDSFHRALHKIEGLSADQWVECERCHLGLEPPDFEPPPELLPAPDKAACPACNGHGVQTTPSLAPQHGVEQCSRCSGNGWIVQAIPEPQTYIAPGVQVTGTGINPNNGLPFGSQGGQGNLDAWQRAPGHPHYGLHPNAVGL